ncbi:hypothetical protein [Sphingomonas adhaesiva]|uniref:hypothetical protein n=1 Tax=Sphingomonas adhaesiva TaxID=28212 RepID=UPI002FF4C303
MPPLGSDSNASTTPTQTVYKLDLPGATDVKLDESLKIFSGMMAEPAITTAGLAAERPAVLAEQREAPGPQVRYGDAIRQTFFAGQPLAERSPIGTIKTLEAATPGRGAGVPRSLVSPRSRGRHHLGRYRSRRRGAAGGQEFW